MAVGSGVVTMIDSWPAATNDNTLCGHPGTGIDDNDIYIRKFDHSRDKRLALVVVQVCNFGKPGRAGNNFYAVLLFS